MSENFTNPKNIIHLDHLISLFIELSSNQDKLINGYKILSLNEKAKGFYIGMLEIIFANQNNKILTKLCCSTFIIFINKNWMFEEYIEQSERLVISSYK